MKPELMDDNLARAIEFYERTLKTEKDPKRIKQLTELISVYQSELRELRR